MLSNDRLTLYFMSDRPGGVGGNDLWASHRACEECPWETPVNLIAVNGPRNENGPALSRDGHLLFFQSNRPGSQLLDIYLATRADKKDDGGWGPALRLGPNVNTSARDIHPDVVPAGDGETESLYFSRGATTHDADIFLAPITRDGAALGVAEPVAELNDPDATIDETSPTVRKDGREIVFRSNRVGSLGAGDLWASTRRSADSPWSPPVNLGPPVSTEYDEVTPSLSFDGRTLFFVSDRPGGAGGYDIWMSTRTRSGDNDVPAPVAAGPAADEPRFSDWSAPVNLGAVVNSPATDIEVAISRDGLGLYLASNRPGGFGGFDIWVSQRAGVGDPWGPPQNLGPSVNTAFREQAPSLTVDGHALYFFSDRPDGFGNTDLYVSRRRDERDDFGWQTPQNLGSEVNTAAAENLAVRFEDTLYFNSARPGVLGGADIFASVLLPDGTFGPAIWMEGLSSPVADAPCAIRRDGLELFLASTRGGTNPTFFDLWVATRASTSDAWSTPVNLGSVINNPPPVGESRCALSFDATALYIISDLPGGVGGIDIWVSTRTKLKGSN